MQPSEIFKNESGAGVCATVWAAERYGRVGCDLFADTRERLMMQFIFTSEFHFLKIYL